MNKQRIVALLGRRDAPTDAVEEYCRYVGQALEPHGLGLELVRVPWAERGWRTALQELRDRSAAWRADWVLLQYTALAWSSRGIPFGALRIPKALGLPSEGGMSFGVVFHDARTFPGTRVIDALRRRCQRYVMQRLFETAGRVILTVPAEKIAWLPAPVHSGKAAFIPVGANLPPVVPNPSQEGSQRDAPAVAVFGVTGGEMIRREASDIAHAVNQAAAKIGRLRLVVLGRNAIEAREPLQRQLDSSRVELQVLGVLPAAEVAQVLSQADVLLFVRGHISSRRSSALAGIACGLPVVAYRGEETAAPITEAGVVLAEEGNRKGLAVALESVLRDAALRQTLRERSRLAQEKYFSWKAIAARYAEVLRSAD